MMTIPQGGETAVSAFLEARREGRRVAPPSAQWPAMELADGYAVQRELVSRQQVLGDKVVGYKIAFTNRAAQKARELDTPAYGHLLKSLAFENGATVPLSRFVQPAVEAEVAFVLKSPLMGPDVTSLDVLRATGALCGAIEIIDPGRLEAGYRTGDAIADNMGAAGYALGDRPHAPDTVDLGRLGALVYRNGEVAGSGMAFGVLGHPARSVAWLARELAAAGKWLEAGQVVLSGSLAIPIPLQAMDTIMVDFGQLGSVALRFE
jgi:2-oxo-hept-3-ene-1,7-dioate hydratase